MNLKIENFFYEKNIKISNEKKLKLKIKNVISSFSNSYENLKSLKILLL